MLDFYKGMDISFVPECEDDGMQIKDFDKTPIDALALAEKYGVNAIRLRIWNNPENVPESGGYCDYKHTLAMAKRAKEHGMEFMLDFHYSDYWADPAQQRKPKAWENLSFEELERAVYEYTRDTLLDFKAEGVLPEMVQIGNEIRSGLLFPDGELPDCAHMVRLVNAGIRGAREAGGSEMKIMIHLDQGGRYFYIKEWFDKAFENGLEDFDVMGLSYYPFWHGTFMSLKSTVEQLVRDYNKPIILAETAHAYRIVEGGFIDSVQEKIAGIEATPEGQRTVLELVMSIMASLPDRMGRGIYYWEPLCVPKKGSAGWASNMSLLDEDGNVMEGIKAFGFERERYNPDRAVKVFEPDMQTVAVGSSVKLPETVRVLYYDASVKEHEVVWERASDADVLMAEPGEYEFVGRVAAADCETVQRVTVKEKICGAVNLLADSNWNDGLVWWRLDKSSDEVAVQIVPEFVEPFPAPPVNGLRIESKKNFTCSLSQQVNISEAGSYILSAEYKGTDTTNVDVRLFAESDDVKADTVIHPFEQEWQRIEVKFTVSKPVTAAVGLKLNSPPVYGIVRRICLEKE